MKSPGRNDETMTSPLDQSKIHKLRASCNLCTRSKLKCDGNKPACRRCADRRIPCVYSRMGRVGRPPRPSTNTTTTTSPPSMGRTTPCRSDQPQARGQSSPPLLMTGLVSSGVRSSYESQANEGEGRQLNNTVATEISTSLNSTTGFEEGQTGSIDTQFSEIWDHWTTESIHATASPASLADLDRLLTPVSEHNMFSTASLPQDSNVRHQKTPSLHQADDSCFYLFETSNPSSITSRCSDFSKGYTMFRADVDHISLEKTINSDKSRTEQVKVQPQDSADFGTLPTKPHSLDHPDPFNEAWQQLSSGITEMYRTLETIVPRASMPVRQLCSCPSLMARLQLVITYPKLANVCSYGSGAKKVPNSKGYPLDLLLFLDEVVYVAVSSILSCRACSNNQRALLNVGLCVDWLTDLARQVLESGLSRLLSAPEPQTQILGTEKSRPGMTGWRGERHEDDVVAENNKARAESDKPISDGSTLRLCVGSFQLNGTVWRMCIRELLKHRLMRMSKTLNYIIGRQGEARSVARNGSKPNPLSSESFLDSIYLRVRAKIEVLFGMLEICDLTGSGLD